MAEITLSSLAHTYETNPSSPEDYAIRKMDHVWHQGGAYALLGPSGCGKSTMLNIISGLLRPSEGDVIFDSRVVNDLSPEERNIAQVFQFPVVYDTMTVFENLAFPLRNIKTPEHKIAPRVHEVADILELTAVLERKAKNLNADEKQKVSMGRGLVRDDVSAILFDEPLTVIDPQLKWKLRRKLKQIHEQFNITMIYVTHDQLEASTFAEKIAVMYEGKMVQFGSPRELFERPAHTFVGFFIGSPGMNFLDVTITESCAQYGDIAIPINPQQHAIARASKSDSIKLGIRPEFIHVWDDRNDEAFEVEVKDVEDLGTYRIMSFYFGDCLMRARLHEDQRVPRKKAYVSFPEQWLTLYIDEYRVEVGNE